MREVPRQWLDNYTDKLNETSEKFQGELRKHLRSIDYSKPVDEWRDVLVGIMNTYCGSASQVAAMESAIFYDGLRERVVGAPMGSFAQDGRQAIATEKSVKAFISKLLDGDYDEFERLCLERLDYEVKRAAGRCTQYNARRDPYSSEVRWARVPTGEETCDFCIMLASRGPVYLSEESAGGDPDHYHPHCDCRIVPFWGTYDNGTSRRGSSMSIEGYDPDALYEQYLGFATDRYRQRMAAAADRAHGEHGGSWKSGLSVKDMGTLHNYIAKATSYEDLIKRVDTVDMGPYYLNDKQWNELLDSARRKRKELLKDSK